jgi:hypothetical protein
MWYDRSNLRCYQRVVTSIDDVLRLLDRITIFVCFYPFYSSPISII